MYICVCCVARVLSWSRAAPPPSLPPVSLFVYVRLESCIHEDASVILTELHTQSRQEA